MSDWRLRRQIDKARLRWRHLKLVNAAALIWLAGAFLVATLLLLEMMWGIAVPQSAVVVTASITIILLVVLWKVFQINGDRRMIARRIEEKFPDLQTSLLAALDVERDVLTGHVGYLQERVIGQALAHAYQNGWHRIVPVKRLLTSHFLHLLLFAAFGLALWQLHARDVIRPVAAGSPTPASEIGQPRKFQVTVEPGNTELELGTSLLVVARFQGPLPADATLVYQPAGTSAKTKDDEKNDDEKVVVGRIPMSKALADPIFGGSISSVRGPLEYRVEFAGQESESYRVSVFEFPRLVKADAQLRFPSYTSLQDKLVQNMRQISAVLGTTITVTLELNKPVVDARLIEKDGSVLELKAVADHPNHYAVEFKLDRTRRYSVHLVDDRQRKNKESAELLFTALVNQPPDLKLAAPGKDTQVSPLEELELKAKAFDDFGLRRVGVTYLLAGQEEKELTLANDVAAKERLELAHVVAFENLKAEPDQLLSYYFWAEDSGPDGEIRRTSSDMFFAEVRPFDEIFRQGEQPAGGQQQQQQQGNQNASAAEKLADLQKEIINATWKLVRREVSGQVSDAFGSDVALLVESQNSALQQAEALAKRVRDPQAMHYIDDVRQHMNQAIRQLMDASEKKAATPLRPALDSEQQAYQGLLKLRAREHQVTRGQRQPGSSQGSSSRSQQQLDQLELKDQKNRYETERTAQAPQDPAEREMRQVLNRLKELARRQGDLNDRIKEVQTALQEAQAEEQKEELRRQLKRLQEEQEQLLRDTEELQARMDQPQNAERMADSREQLDNARERVRQSSEALREGMVSQAASAGARAKEDFEQLRDEFRKQTSDRFQQEVRDLSEQAKQLDEREQQLAEQLQQLQDPKSQGAKSLREANDREKLIEGFGEQKQRSNELLERMRQTIQDAESPQPLLAEQLYDTVRQTQQRNLAQNLETTQEALRRGLMEPAKQQEESAHETIREMRAGIDRAAQSVLEDETEALRRAQNELNNLSRQLGNELARNGQSPPNENGQPNSQGAGQESDPNAQSTGKDGGQSEGNPSEQSNGKDKSNDSESQGKGKQQGKSQGKSGEGQQKSDGQSRGKNQNGNEKSGSGQGTGQPGEQQRNGQQGGQGQNGQGQNGQPQNGQQQNGQQGGSPNGQQPNSQNGSPTGQGQGDPNAQAPNSPANGSRPDGQRGAPGDRNGQRGSFDQLAGPGGGGGGNERMMSPFTGEDFREWSDRLRDVEEMLGDPQLSAEAGRIRERARALRAESKRHSAPPNWDLVKMQVAEPLAELLDKVRTELLKRTKSDLLVPLDRDPVPPEYAEQVRKYYERLGTGK